MLEDPKGKDKKVSDLLKDVNSKFNLKGHTLSRDFDPAGNETTFIETPADFEVQLSSSTVI